MSELLRKEQKAVRLLRSIGERIEIAYSGGKDSDVMLALARLAGVDYVAVHKCTTIDRPGTLRHCEEAGAEIVRPPETFLQMVRRKGFPTRRVRWCCQAFKETPGECQYFAVGVRTDESRERRARYKEPIQCRVYGKGVRRQMVMPLLDWTAEDERLFITSNNVRLHPHYYDEEGRVDVSRRLGCIGCPLRGDRGKSDFLQYPKMLRQWLRAASEWWDAPREQPLMSQCLYSDVYALFYANTFCRSYADMVRRVETIGGQQRCREFLSEFFNVEL